MLGQGARSASARDEPEIHAPSKEERTKLFNRLDNNGNGGLSLAEIDKGVIELWPSFNCKPALLRAYKAADKSGDGFIGRREFRLLLKLRLRLQYWNSGAEVRLGETSPETAEKVEMRTAQRRDKPS